MKNTALLPLVAGALAGGVLAGIFRSKVRALVQRLGRGRTVIATLLLVLSGLFAYPAVHEFGHFSVAEMMGGDVKEVHWTALSPGGPRVEWGGPMPKGSREWAAAASVCLPLAVALGLGGIWAAVGFRLPWIGSMGLLMPSALFFVATAGSGLELFSGRGHLHGLAGHLGMGWGGVLLFYLVPTVLSVLGLGTLVWRIRRISSPPEIAEES